MYSRASFELLRTHVLTRPCPPVRGMWDGLIPARAGYLAHISPPYDEVLHEVAHRTEHTGILGRTDIAALTVWATDLMSLPDSHVRAVTGSATTHGVV